MPRKKKAVAQDSGRAPVSREEPAGKEASAASSPPAASFPVVAIGASAGGLEAIQTFFRHMPPGSGAAFVIVQHLSPDYKSMMAEILQQSTTMEVRQAEEGVRIEPGKVYTNVPGRDLLIKDGRFMLAEPETKQGRRLPIDRFFRSLAEDQQENIICVLLSGTGSDGTLGLRAVKGVGGIAIAQEGDASFQDMPQSAIASGLVDCVLPASQMPARIMELINNRPRLSREAGESPETQGRDVALQKILRRLKLRTGHDFSLYKRNTILRRIERRMLLLQLRETGEYEEYIRRNDAELKILFQELLIGVTNFFRDPDSYAVLGKSVIPQLFANKQDSETIRVWVSGCSTGEEAYSMAILLDEYMRSSDKLNRVQIFATDIDEDSLEHARNGLYDQDIVADVSSERLSRYFVKEGHSYRIIKPIREMLIFAPHSLIKDPPYSHMDLISCRNLLIYLGADLQRKVLPLFHYALNPNGFLFLGPSESASEYSNLFVPVDRKWKIFQRRGGMPGRLPDLPMLSSEGFTEKVKIEEKQERRETFAQQSEQLLLKQFVPAGVVVNDQYEPFHFFGPVDRYFKVKAGESTRSVLLLAREDLRLHLRTAIREAVKEGGQIRRDGLTFQVGDKTEKFSLVVTPLKEDSKYGRLFLVVFEHFGWEDVQAGEHKGLLPAESAGLVASLEEELKAAKTQLQTTVEELDGSNEELKSSNEELMSMNEELQSSNEELETSREELHSINEELTTVNAEMQQKVEELAKANSDLQNLMNSTRIATLFLDKDLVIRRFTAQVGEYFNILDVDIGRPFTHLRPKIEYPDVLEDIRKVLNGLRSMERQLNAADGRWIMVRIMPYRTGGDQITGVVMTLVDVTALKSAEQQLTERTAELESLYRIIPDMFLRIGPDDRILGLRAWGEPDLISEPEAQVGKALPELFPGSGGQELERVVREVRAEKTPKHIDLRIAAEGEEGRFLEARVMPAGEEVYAILRDMTSLRKAGEYNRFQADALSQVSDGLVAVDNDGVIIIWSAGTERLLAVPAKEALGRELESVTGFNWIKANQAVTEAAQLEKRPWVRELELTKADGGKVLVESSVSIILNNAGRKIGLLSVLRDISDRKRFERELLEAKQAAETASRTKSMFLANMSHEIRTPLNGITGMTDLVLGTELSDRQRTYLTAVKDSATSLNAIINDVLDFSKIEAGKLELAEQPINLASLLEASLASVRLTAEEKGLSLGSSINPGVPTLLMGDPVRLKQILVNLVGNAVKFTERGGIDIQVGTLDLPPPTEARKPKAENGQGEVRLLFSVRDTGIGIPVENQKVIFEMFAQGDIGPTKKYVGTGLGLTITRTLVEMMHGHIWVVSQMGQGSTFYFTVRLRKQGPQAAQPAQEKPTRLEPLRILVAEDNATNRYLAEEFLRLEGHTVTSVVDGQEALEALQREPFDVVLMDVSMPRMDGIAATQRIRESASGAFDPKIPIIALTAHAFKEDEERVKKAGMDDYVAKPLSIADLNKALKRVLRKRAAKK